MIHSLSVIKSAAIGDSPTKVKYLSRIDQIEEISPEDREMLRKVSERYVFRANDYYLRLIDWKDPKDPIRQLIIPRTEELNDWGKLDASNEAAVTVEQGCQHKYADTALLLCNEVCGAYCRYCFRKRLFMNDNEEVSKDVSAGVSYIRRHPQITNVLLTGGDPLIMGTRRLGEIITQLREIEHVRIIRIGSKMPAFNPFRVLDDPELQDLFRTHSTPEKRIYLMCHFDHPRELTPEARKGIAKLLECGVVCVNQCPMIRGINDDPAVLAELFRDLSYIGCPQYYVFQGRPTAGNEPFEVPIVEGWRIFSEAVVRESGLAGRARFCMSHASGKVEIQAVDEERIYLRYHRSKHKANSGRFFVCRRDDQAFWLDHLTPEEGSFVPTGVEFGQVTRAPRTSLDGLAEGPESPAPTPGPVVRSGGAGVSACGFTLVELLVVIAIIALLISILAPSLAAARRAARSTRELAAIKQLGSAYAAYAGDNRGRVMPGYLRGSWADPVKRRFLVYQTPSGADEDNRLSGSVIRPYPWRMMPYVDFSIEALVADAGLVRTIRSQTEDRTDPNSMQQTLARHPSFGMNTTYVGGDAHRGGFYAPSTRRWGQFYVERMDQVRSASSLIIFASARGVRDNSGGEKAPGFHRLEGPWRATPTSNSVPAFIPLNAPAGRFDPNLPTTAYGHVDYRHDGKAQLVAFDGHADAMDILQAKDMRRWCNLATSANWQPR